MDTALVIIGIISTIIYGVLICQVISDYSNRKFSFGNTIFQVLVLSLPIILSIYVVNSVIV